jgi:hypothetical protein
MALGYKKVIFREVILRQIQLIWDIVRDKTKDRRK